MDLVEWDVHLVRDRHRDGGGDPLRHLRPRQRKRHRAVRVDRDGDQVRRRHRRVGQQVVQVVVIDRLMRGDRGPRGLDLQLSGGDQRRPGDQVADEATARKACRLSGDRGPLLRGRGARSPPRFSHPLFPPCRHRAPSRKGPNVRDVGRAVYCRAAAQVAASSRQPAVGAVRVLREPGLESTSRGMRPATTRP